MRSGGWIKLHRCLQDNELWLSESFTKGQAWVDLIIIANYETGRINKRGISVPLERGDVGYNERSMSERWGWSRGKVRRFIEMLITEGMIKRVYKKKSSVGTCLKIVNYRKYQQKEKEKTERAFSQKTVPKNNDKTVPKNMKKNNVITDTTGCSPVKTVPKNRPHTVHRTVPEEEVQEELPITYQDKNKLKGVDHSEAFYIEGRWVSRHTGEIMETPFE